MRMPPTTNAASTAISGKEEFAQRVCHHGWLPSGHQQADLFQRRDLRIDFAGDPPFVNHQQAIGQRRHFFELGRDQQDRAAGVAQRDELAVDELDRADIDAARRLRHEQQLRLQLELAADDQLLLIAARQRARRQLRIRRTHIEALDDLGGAPPDRRARPA